MIIFPAIDIKNGKVVRLLQGKFDQVTEYGQDPCEMARHWAAIGAEWLHIVDLDGAQNGHITNWGALEAIAQTVNIPLEIGGGIRSEKDIERLIKMGYSRVILGTKAIADPEFLKTVVQKWPEYIAVSIDAHNGKVTTLGWTEDTDVDAVDFAKKLESYGLKYLIFTDIACDGMLTGPNIGSLKKMLAATNIPLIASGGVANIEDIKALAKLCADGLIGAITGKALYEGTLDLKKALLEC